MLKMSDIAFHAGVSPTTVSFVLNDRSDTLRISEKTRQKVLQAVEELGYRSNHMARAMRTGNSKMLGFLGGYTAEEQVGRMLHGALEAADAQGYTLKLLRLDALGGSAQQVIRRISELRLMGVLALHLPDAVLGELHVEAEKCGTPLVLLDARCDNAAISQVVSDDEGGIAAGVAHLVGLGHTKIGFICGGGNSEANLSSVRKEAFKTAMAMHRLSVRPEYLQDGLFSQREASRQAAQTLLELPVAQRPTAVLCSGDLIALATLQVAHELGLSVPADLSVMGFANMMVSEFATPPLTTIEQPFADMGRAAVEILLSIINQGENPCGNLQILPTRVVERASTAPLHQ